MPFAGAIFDWDGVVVNSSKIHEESWEILARENNLPLAPEHFALGFGKRNQVIIPEILQWTEDSSTIERWSSKKECIYRSIASKKGIPLVPGIKALLLNLKEKRIPCVVGTSTERNNVLLAFKQHNLEAFFCGIVSSEDVTRGKPDPEVFHKAARVMQQTPGNCVVFEDSLHGLQAARSGGMKAVGITTTNSKDSLLEAGAEIVVDEMRELDEDRLSKLFQ